MPLTRDCRCGFALADLLTLLAAFAVAGSLFLVACGTAGDDDNGDNGNDARRPGDYGGALSRALGRGRDIEVQNHVRSLAQGIYSARMAGMTLSSDDTPLDRFNRLIEQGHLQPGQLVAPRDPDRTAATSTPIEADTLSYALLHSESPAWRGSAGNRRTPFIADRLIDDERSIWADPWEGYVGWGDGSATYEEDRHVQTVINGHRHERDDLFSGDPETQAVLR